MNVLFARSFSRPHTRAKPSCTAGIKLVPPVMNTASMLLAGEHDTFAPPAMLEAYAQEFPKAEVRIVSGTDHYFWRREREAAAIVGTFAEGVLTPA